MKREDVIRELQTLLPNGLAGYQVAKSILKLSEQAPGTFKRVGPNGSGRKRAMSKEEALRFVEQAIRRIELADAPD